MYKVLKAHIDDSLRRNLVSLHYQPKVNLHTGVICGAEALLRLPGLHGLHVQPQVVVNIAETDGQIVALGEAVMREACRGICEMANTGVSIPVSVNVSIAQVIDETFFDKVLNTLKNFDLINTPELLEIEITESVMAPDLRFVVGVLERLRNLGIRLSLDDFGVGFSSLNQLKMLPVTGIKIDKSFVDHIAFDAKDRAIIKMIVALANEFSLDIVAEGVEQQAQADWLAQNGCNHAQGYLFGKPMGLDALLKTIEVDSFSAILA